MSEREDLSQCVLKRMRKSLVVRLHCDEVIFWGGNEAVCTVGFLYNFCMESTTDCKIY